LSVGLGLERKNLEWKVCEWGTFPGIGWVEKILMGSGEDEENLVVWG